MEPIKNTAIGFGRSIIKLEPAVENVVMSRNRSETECSACGRFIGSWERCPFCRHFNPKRRPVRLIKYSSPLLTVAGICLLSWMGKTQSNPSVHIAELGRKTNFAQVRIQGRIDEDIRFHQADPDSGSRSGSLEFQVDDGTGVLRVRCYEDACRELLESRKIPGRGDRVSLIGNYQYKAKRQFIILSSAADLEIDRPQPIASTPLAKLLHPYDFGLDPNQRFKVTGRITGVFAGRYDLAFRLEDPDNLELMVNLSQSMMEAWNPDGTQTHAWSMLKKGDYVTCTGVLEQQKRREGRTWQLLPAGPDDVRKTDEATWKSDHGGN